MFRQVLVYQLVLSFAVGPLLCCCTGARLSHDASVAQAGPMSGRKHCCEHESHRAPAEQQPAEKPSEPKKCPCKDAPAKVAAVVDGPATGADALALLLAEPTIAVPCEWARPVCDVGQPPPRFDHLLSTPSADDILFAHHNLRC